MFLFSQDEIKSRCSEAVLTLKSGYTSNTKKAAVLHISHNKLALATDLQTLESTELLNSFDVGSPWVIH